jgi:DNA-directed RNA polymerase subunit K/omega
MEIINNKKLTKFEKTRLLSARALQIAENAPLNVKPNAKEDSYDLAVKELEANKMPLKVVRRTVTEEHKIMSEEVN